MKRIYIACDECAHLRTKSGWMMTCDAFTDGIPLDSWQYAAYRPCNNGIWFEQKQGTVLRKPPAIKQKATEN